MWISLGMYIAKAAINAPEQAARAIKEEDRAGRRATEPMPTSLSAAEDNVDGSGVTSGVEEGHGEGGDGDEECDGKDVGGGDNASNVDSGETDGREGEDDSREDPGLSVVTQNSPGYSISAADDDGQSSEATIWGGVRRLAADCPNERASMVFFLLKAAAHTHAKLLVPQLHFILQYAAVQSTARPAEGGPEAAIFLE